MQSKLHILGRIFINTCFGVIIVCLCFTLIQIFFLTSFKIPSDSMEPVLEPGDYVLVNKLIPGARLFNIFDSLNEEQVEIMRMPGVREIRRGDVVVFNFPHPYTWEKVEMHIMKYYIKRCVGLPGDTVEIDNGIFRINKEIKEMGNRQSQELIGKMKKEQFAEGVYNAFPYDSVMGWNIQNFGPLYIPGKGDRIAMNRVNYLLYHKLIAWELGATVEWKDQTVWLDGKAIDSYTFQKNYYFMAGDKGENSQDSRYWGLLPEEYIVGKAFMIWKAVDPYTGKIRWNRTMRMVND